MCKHLDMMIETIMSVYHMVIPKLHELLYIPVQCLGEGQYFFCMELNFWRLKHRSVHTLETLAEYWMDVKEFFHTHIPSIHDIKHSVKHFFKHDIGHFFHHAFGFLDFGEYNFIWMSAANAVITFAIAALAYLDFTVGHANYDSIVRFLH